MADKNDEEMIWLSPQGRSPVLIRKKLLTDGASTVFRRMFDGSMKFPPRVAALEAATLGAPVYLVDVPEAILTMLLDVLLHPQLQFLHSMNTSHPEANTRRLYLRYYDLFTKKRTIEDEDEAEEREAKRRKKEENAACDKAILELIQKITSECPVWEEHKTSKRRMTLEFINTYRMDNAEVDLSQNMTINGEEQPIACYFFMQSDRGVRFEEIFKSLHHGVSAIVWWRRWERDLFDKKEMRPVNHWPANLTATNIDARHHEIVEVIIFFKQ